MATLAYFVVGRLFGPGNGRMRRRGLFGDAVSGREDEAEALEFGYCFDVAIRAFFPVWIFIYVIQFILWPLISKDYLISIFFGNTLYLVAFVYYNIIIFLGFNDDSKDIYGLLTRLESLANTAIATDQVYGEAQQTVAFLPGPGKSG
ncbi:MAG: hypothetical protein Q9212_006092 [Teloschistes hypoglaucus]